MLSLNLNVCEVFAGLEPFSRIDTLLKIATEGLFGWTEFEKRLYGRLGNTTECCVGNRNNATIKCFGFWVSVNIYNFQQIKCINYRGSLIRSLAFINEHSSTEASEATPWYASLLSDPLMHHALPLTDPAVSLPRS